jgi:membrane protein required for beta-lactamase induction
MCPRTRPGTRRNARLLYVRSIPVKRPSLGALCLALIPFLAMCFSVSAWDRVDPMIFGLPFNMFWLLLWIMLTSLCMWGVYKLEAPRIAESDAKRARASASRPE